MKFKTQSPKDSRRLRFQFGLGELATAIALFAAGLGFVTWLRWLFTEYDGHNGGPAFVLACTGMTSCFLSAVGVLIGRGISAAFVGAIVGFVASLILMVLLYIVLAPLGGL